MIYTDLFLHQPKRIPTLVALGIIVVLIFILSRLFTITPSVSKAAKQTLQERSIVNLTHNQAGIFWRTDSDSTSGSIVYGVKPTELKYTENDERDLPKKKGKYLNHFVPLKNLKENTTYYYKIIVGYDKENRVVSEPNNMPFSFTTPTNFPSLSTLSPAYGKVIKPNGQTLENAPVLLSISGSYPLLAFTKTTGEWLIPLHSIVDQKTNVLKLVNKNEQVSIKIWSEEKEETSVNLPMKQLSPLPQTLIIGKKYNFSDEDNILAATEKKKKRKEEPIDIIFPKDEAIIPASSPLIKGRALPQSSISIRVQSKQSKRQYTAVTTARADGIWNVSVGKSLPNGAYLLSIDTKNEKGQKITLARNFTIAKSGEQVLQAATAPATPTLTPLPEPTILPSATPTFPLEPSPTEVLEPSPTSEVPSESPTPSLPRSGINIVPLSALGAALIVIGFGLIILF